MRGVNSVWDGYYISCFPVDLKTNSMEFQAIEWPEMLLHHAKDLTNI
jgi:hypothetical protein